MNCQGKCQKNIDWIIRVFFHRWYNLIVNNYLKENTLKSSLSKSPYWSKWFPVLLIFVVAVLAYLPHLASIGYYRDDWNLIYAAHGQGADKLIEMYSIDRPGAGYLMAALYNLFGDSVLPYSIAAFIWRTLSAILFFSLIRQIWPKETTAAAVGGVLFAIYPGFLQQYNPIQYQPHQLNMVASLLSIVLSLAAVQSTKRAKRWGFTVAAMLASLASLSMMEYYIGLEGLRFFALFLLSTRKKIGFKRQFVKTLLWYSPYLLTIAVFLYWRLFIFVSIRPTTRPDAMLQEYLSAPLYQILLTFSELLKDVFEVVFQAWAVPAYQLAGSARLREFLTGLAFAAAAAIIIGMGLWQMDNKDDKLQPSPSGTRSFFEMAALGSITVIICGIPIIFGNREVSFSLTMDRFAYPGSTGGILLITALIQGWVSQPIRKWIPIFLVGTAVLTHYANGDYYSNWWQTARSYWWQLAWRAPQIQPDTVLMAQMPGFPIEEDYEIWGPANLIYYPASPALQISAEVLNPRTLQDVIMQRGSERNMRTIEVERDYANLLLLSVPTAQSCLQVVNGSNPLLSSSEQYRIQLAAPYSKLDRIIGNSTPAQPPTAVFGPEPAHTWCYYYQKAALAQQNGNWNEVARLGDEAREKGLKPVDRVEWLPFLLAYAYTGDTDQARQIIPIVTEERYLGFQVCQFLNREKELQRIQSSMTAGHQFLLDSICR